MHNIYPFTSTEQTNTLMMHAQPYKLKIIKKDLRKGNEIILNRLNQPYVFQLIEIKDT